MTTRAIVIDRLGSPDVLTEREIPLPMPGKGEVRLRVLAAGVNFADLLMRMGLYGTVPPRPFSPGFEVAGEVEAVGPDSGHEVHPGQRVIALLRHGGYARRVVVSAEQVFPWPRGMSSAQAAGFPVIFLTAWVCLFRAGSARAGERLLVLGGAGGVGTAAIQLGRRADMRVFATAGTKEKCRYVERELGAERCLLSGEAWDREIASVLGSRGIDLILDPVGGRATRRARKLLAPLGRLVFFGLSEAAPGLRRNWLRAAWAWLRTPRIHPADLIEPNVGFHGVHLLHLQDRSSILREALAELQPAFEDGALRLVLDRTFPLSATGAAEAHRYLHERRNIGKVVLVAPDGDAQPQSGANASGGGSATPVGGARPRMRISNPQSGPTAEHR